MAEIDFLKSALLNSNVIAFLKMISLSEGADYNSLFGDSINDPNNRKTFDSYSNHPSCQYPQLPKPYGYTTYVNKAGESINTSAAGRYQIIKPTWIGNGERKGLQQILQLPDFSPQSQDIAALELLSEKDVVQKLMDGNFSVALEAAASILA